MFSFRVSSAPRSEKECGKRSNDYFRIRIQSLNFKHDMSQLIEEWRFRMISISRKEAERQKRTR